MIDAWRITPHSLLEAETRDRAAVVLWLVVMSPASAGLLRARWHPLHLLTRDTPLAKLPNVYLQ